MTFSWHMYHVQHYCDLVTAVLYVYFSFTLKTISVAQRVRIRSVSLVVTRGDEMSDTLTSEVVL